MSDSTEKSKKVSSAENQQPVEHLIVAGPWQELKSVNLEEEEDPDPSFASPRVPHRNASAPTPSPKRQSGGEDD